MVAAAKAASNPVIPDQSFLISKDEAQKGVSSHWLLHQEVVRELSLMHLGNSQNPLYPVVLPFWQVLQ